MLQTVLCLLAAHASYRLTEQTDRRKSDLSSGAHYVTLAKN